MTDTVGGQIGSNERVYTNILGEARHDRIRRNGST